MAASHFSSQESLLSRRYKGSRQNELNVFELEKLLYTGKSVWQHADEVWPNLYLGDQEIAANKGELMQMNITHILNASHSRFRGGEENYKGMNICYLGIEAQDSPTFDMSIHFYPAADFINKAITGRGSQLRTKGTFLAFLNYHNADSEHSSASKMRNTRERERDDIVRSDGKILVHCAVGVSRSATLVLAFLMIHHKMTLVEAITAVKERRGIIPNRGFLRQLLNLDKSLHKMY